MAIKRNLTEQLNVLIDYVKKETEGDDWITLTYRDIANLAGTSPGSSVTKRLMEGLKEDENILFRLNLDPSKSKKPLQFKFVDKETKYNAIDNKRYHNLTEKEVEFIKNRLGYRDHTELYNILSYLNYLKSLYGEKRFVMPPAEEISDTLLILEQDVTLMNDFLLNHNLLIDENSKFRICLKKTGKENAVDSKVGNKMVGAPRSPIAEIDLQRLNSKPPNEALMTLLDQLESHQTFLRSYVEQKVLDEISETKDLRNQLDDGHQMLQKVLKENQGLQDRNLELELEKNKLEANLDKSIRFKDDLINAAQEFLQIFNWQVQQVALKDSNMSAEAKNSKAYRAKLFQQYIDVGQEFYQNIIDFVKN